MESRAQARLLDQIIARRPRFLRFLQGRVEDLATAEDILQSAYLWALERSGEIRDGESIVAWFIAFSAMPPSTITAGGQPATKQRK
jgi:DNA-directed RNA polymerase specialized sigma24 family protein